MWTVTAMSSRTLLAVGLAALPERAAPLRT